ncbi:arrestin domain-containing protein 3-like [Fundulus heteroclitus]|uniref:arrestin domain-containing protein 3-like n=1 Tax=Fundulus heteroclitus TaxID=8078 RepID=UPI00165B2C92|nr:arrestin domain-containing protein 3-like [Fundulus heteroclitus]
MPSSTIKNINVTFKSMNNKYTLTYGDTFAGEVTVEVEKECRINSLYIAFKGKTNVMWTEPGINSTKFYHAKVKYFSVRQYFVTKKTPNGNTQIVLKNQSGEAYSNVLTPGTHVYPFSFQFPNEGIPCSFSGRHGMTSYCLEAVLSRTMKRNKKSWIPISFAAKADINSIPGLMEPVHESVEKKMKVFTSGSVAMDVKLERSGFFQGDDVSVLIRIQNNSPHDVKPKYSIYRKDSFFAGGKRKCVTTDIIKEEGTPIPPSASENVANVFTIPKDLQPSMLSCSIIKVEYRFKVYLDVKHALDPEIKVNIVILPASEVPSVEPAADFTNGSQGNCGNPDHPARGFARPCPPAEPSTSSGPTYGAFGTNHPWNDVSY